MSLIAVVYLLLYAKLLQGEHTTNTKQYLLLQTVFPVTTIKGVSYWLVKLRVHLVICIKEIQFHATHIHTPYVCVNEIVHVWHINNKRITVLVKLSYNWQRVEVLGIIVCNLLSVDAQTLLEISESV